MSSYKSRDKYGNPRTGEKVDELLTKIDDLKDATPSVSGLMASTDKVKLDELEDDVEMTIAEINELLNF